MSWFAAALWIARDYALELLRLATWVAVLALMLSPWACAFCVGRWTAP